MQTSGSYVEKYINALRSFSSVLHNFFVRQFICNNLWFYYVPEIDLSALVLMINMLPNL
jgi:hypothetical protein